MKIARLLVAAAFMLGLLLPFGTIVQAQGDIVDVAAADGRFTTLVTAVQAAGLEDALRGEGPLTVFAPTDDAFARLPEGTVEALLDDIPTLTDILLYHVVSGQVMAADVVELTSAETLQGDSISITVENGRVFLNKDVEVIITDVEASNGVIHVIDAVLLPPAAEEAHTELPAVGVAPEAMGPSLILLAPLGAAAAGAAGLWARRKFRG